MAKIKYIFGILFMMSEFWFLGLPASGAFGALAYMMTNNNFFSIAVFAWFTGIYFALEYAEISKALEEK